MTIALYVDEDSQDSSLIRALRSRGVDVIAASEAGMNGRLDDEQLCNGPRLTPVSCTAATLAISISFTPRFCPSGVLLTSARQ